MESGSYSTPTSLRSSWMRLNGRGIVSADQPDFTLSESSPHPAIHLCSTRNTKRETPTYQESKENHPKDFCLPLERKLCSDWPCPTCLRTDRLPSDVSKHEEIKCTHGPNSFQRVSEAARTGEGSVRRSQTVHRTLSADCIDSSDPPHSLMALVKASLLG